MATDGRRTLRTCGRPRPVAHPGEWWRCKICDARPCPSLLDGSAEDQGRSGCFSLSTCVSKAVFRVCYFPFELPAFLAGKGNEDRRVLHRLLGREGVCKSLSQSSRGVNCWVRNGFDSWTFACEA